MNVYRTTMQNKNSGTVNSLYCGHPRDRELVSLTVTVRNSGNLFQSNICNLLLPGIKLQPVLLGCPRGES